jgi:hypothetical protein
MPPLGHALLLPGNSHLDSVASVRAPLGSALLARAPFRIGSAPEHDRLSHLRAYVASRTRLASQL